MSRNSRLGLVLAALVALVVAFVALRPGDDDEEPTAAQPAAQESAPATTASPARTAPAQTTTTPRRARRPQPPLLQAGRERELEVESGEMVRFRVRHPSPEEVHVHGYDISRDLRPGRTTTVQFRATLEGVFEIELEQSATPLAQLTVTPD
jgi:FtsP/CotA-like multicopper oxidase with cupredoxin domain